MLTATIRTAFLRYSAGEKYRVKMYGFSTVPSKVLLKFGLNSTAPKKEMFLKRDRMPGTSSGASLGNSLFFHLNS